MEGSLSSNFKKAQELLKEAGYDGTPIVLMHSTDLHVLTNLAPVAKSLMEKAGFKVDMQSMDWQTLVARRSKKDPPNAGGWHAFLTSWVAADITNPIFMGFMNAGCDKAMFGWPCDAEMGCATPRARSRPAKHKAIAERCRCASPVPRTCTSAMVPGARAQVGRRHGRAGRVLERHRTGK
jgi:peptide/nickel transport system substrate-binding protein